MRGRRAGRGTNVALRNGSRLLLRRFIRNDILMNTLEDETGTTDAINGYGFRNLTLNNLYIFFVFCERRLIDTDLYGFY